MLGAFVALATLMLALSQSYKHTRHSWFFRPDVQQLEVRPCAHQSHLLDSSRPKKRLLPEWSTRWQAASCIRFQALHQARM